MPTFLEFCDGNIGKNYRREDENGKGNRHKGCAELATKISEYSMATSTAANMHQNKKYIYW